MNAHFQPESVSLDLLKVGTRATVIGIDWASLEWQFFFEMTARHFPGIAPALRTVWDHAMETYGDDLSACCFA